ncbi:hypothetical protein PtA15_6A249 [Puccinia triticina]|uniref:Acyl-CoA thioesterase II n=1 Tax=Puccinia triticina TaxID=208348 RepID=A0ABY7CK54_9BASI|nr:uncharacterized protein PtA15_6A249 [Puccinia triticina]WAQ85621.1 hypothetical protein PtA15_6A249 [Puccinia triticina]
MGSASDHQSSSATLTQVPATVRACAVALDAVTPLGRVASACPSFISRRSYATCGVNKTVLCLEVVIFHKSELGFGDEILPPSTSKETRREGWAYGSSRSVQSTPHSFKMALSKQGPHIEELIELQDMNEDMFKSVMLWTLDSGTNVFGGIVIAQATHAAVKTVEAGFHLHSLHCYFSGFAAANLPTGIDYQVERIRDGNSYATRSVKAIQQSRCIFSLLISFHRPEIKQPSFQVKIDLSSVIAPENCQPLEASLQHHINVKRDSLPPNVSDYIEQLIKQIKANAVEHRDTRSEQYHSKIHGSSQAYWFRARAKIRSDPVYHKMILAYASDFGFIDTVRIGMGLHSPGGPRPRASMLVSISHSMFFYDQLRPSSLSHTLVPCSDCGFDVSEWMLYKMEAETAKEGRGLVVGRIYARDGRLIAVCAQEGVVRAEAEVQEAGAKL